MGRMRKRPGVAGSAAFCRGPDVEAAYGARAAGMGRVRGTGQVTQKAGARPGEEAARKGGRRRERSNQLRLKTIIGIF